MPIYEKRRAVALYTYVHEIFKEQKSIIEVKNIIQNTMKKRITAFIKYKMELGMSVCCKDIQSVFNHSGYQIKNYLKSYNKDTAEKRHRSKIQKNEKNRDLVNLDGVLLPNSDKFKVCDLGNEKKTDKGKTNIEKTDGNQLLMNNNENASMGFFKQPKDSLTNEESRLILSENGPYDIYRIAWDTGLSPEIVAFYMKYEQKVFTKYYVSNEQKELTTLYKQNEQKLNKSSRKTKYENSKTPTKIIRCDQEDSKEKKTVLTGRRKRVFFGTCR